MSGDADPTEMSDHVLGTEKPVPLDWQTEIAYETCVGLINQVVGVYSARLWDEQHAASPDDATVADLQRAMTHYVTLRQNLRPDDTEQVARITQECAAIIREFRQKPR